MSFSRRRLQSRVCAAGMLAAFLPSGMAGTVRVPCEMARDMMYVRVRINGSGPLWLNVDTGASHSAINPEIAKMLGLREAERGEASGIGRGQSTAFGRVDGATIQVGEGVLRDQSILTMGMGFLASQLGHVTDGTLGWNIFHQYVVRMDYAHGEIELADAADWKPEGAGVELPIELRSNMPFVRAKVRLANGNEAAGTFLIDSGMAGAAVALNQAFQDAHPELGAQRTIEMPPAISVGGAYRYRLTRISALKIGPFTLTNPITVLPEYSNGLLGDASIAGMIGADALSRFVVTFDYAHRRMFLRENARFTMPFESDMSGLQLMARPPSLHRWEVTGVIADSPAGEAGIRKGDVIASVDGRTAADLTLGAVEEGFMRAGEVRRLAIQREGQELRIDLRLRRLI